MKNSFAYLKNQNHMDITLLQPMFAQLEQITPLSAECKAELTVITRVAEYPRNTVLHSPGTTAHLFYFLLQGIGRVYYFSDGKEITDYFASEHQFIGALDSLFFGKPSVFGVQFLEDVKTLVLRYADLERLYSRFHELERIGRIIATQSYLDELERTITFQTMTAEARYQELMRSEGHLLQRVPLGHIASYLGISQVQLSRIRAKRNKDRIQKE